MDNKTVYAIYEVRDNYDKILLGVASDLFTAMNTVQEDALDGVATTLIFKTHDYGHNRKRVTIYNENHEAIYRISTVAAF